mgnify:CR=1 FL=1
MVEPLIACLPGAGEVHALERLYLDMPLPEASAAGGPFIYANYIASLDGRISVADASGRQHVPDAIANPRDRRLLEELAGHADLVLCSGRYLRELAAGSAQAGPPVSAGAAFADIHAARIERGLAPQPDIAVLSASLDFPVPTGLLAEGRRVIAMTSDTLPPERIEAQAQAGVEVIPLASALHPGVRPLASALAGLGHRRIYALAGPFVLHSLLAAGLLDTLFLTSVHRVIGGTPFASLCEGEQLAMPADFRLSALYLDCHGPAGCSQSFARYDRRRDAPG